MIYVRDKIQTIVESIKSTGSVSGWVDNTGSYTVTTSTTGNLEVGFKVVLIYADTSLNRDVIITAKTDTTFTYSGTGIAEPATWKMALYFEVGHRIELNKLYTNKAKSSNKLVQEYPLIWLYTDFQKNKGDGEYTAFETSLQFAIADFSIKGKYEAARITDKFKPVLYPYMELIETAFNTGTNKRNFVTTFGEDSEIRFSPIDRPFFGSADETKNVLPQVTDAIEVEVDLKWKIENCATDVIELNLIEGGNFLLLG